MKKTIIALTLAVAFLVTPIASAQQQIVVNNYNDNAQLVEQLRFKLIELLQQLISQLQSQLNEKLKAEQQIVTQPIVIQPQITIQQPQQQVVTQTTPTMPVQKWTATEDWFKQNVWTDCNCSKKTLRIGISKLARIINNENGTASLSIDGKTLTPALLGGATSYNAIFILDNADPTKEYDYTVTFSSDLSEGNYSGKAKMTCQ